MPIHVVKENETIDAIAKQYGISMQRLMYDNEIYNPTHLVVGQALLILLPIKLHQVKENDTLYRIARDYQVDVLTLVRNNPFVLQQQALNIGDTIVIEYEGTKSHPITINGYTYPNISGEVLMQTLPYLTTLSIFSYGFTEDGDLISIDDEDVIEFTRKNGVDPILVLTPLNQNGIFTNDLVSKVAQNEDLQDKLISQLLETIEEKKYAGINVDFEFIRKEDGDGYTVFVQKLRQRMNDRDLSVTVNLSPKSCENQPGILYEGMNYALLGEVANKAHLMTYEWGNIYGPPMAVAPINQVQMVFDYAVSQISPNKLDLGIPNYGYDWPLPYEREKSRASYLNLKEALELAYSRNAQIQFDTISQCPYYSYQKEGKEHIVWFEDVRSLQEKLDLLKAYQFGGVGYWHLMNFYRPNWLLLHKQFHIL